MSVAIPIIIAVVTVLLILTMVIGLIVAKKQRMKGIENLSVKKGKAFWIQWATGLLLSLTGAFLMFRGDILGENTIGIARVVGIVGIGLIATSNVTLQILIRKSIKK